MRPSQNPKLIYELKPRVKITTTHLSLFQRNWWHTITINDQGVRGEPIPAPKTKPRILVLGDSYTFGWGVNDHETYPYCLQQELRGRVEVINLGVPGYNTVQEVELMRSKGINYHPDLVVLAINNTDLLPGIFTHGYQIKLTRLSNIYTVFFWLDFLLEYKIMARHPLDPLPALGALDQLVSLAAKHRFGLYVCFLDDCSFANVFVPYLAQQRIPFRVIGPDLSKLGFVIPKDGHPSKEGYRYLAQKTSKDINDVLIKISPQYQRILADRVPSN